MLSCFNSSLENARISLISVDKNLFKIALPKDPVPPVIKSVLFLNLLISFSPNYFFWATIVSVIISASLTIPVMVLQGELTSNNS
jgi:hypothetical protein